MNWRLVLLVVVTTIVLRDTGFSQQAIPPPSKCPLLVTLASSKVLNPEGEYEMVIHYRNQGRKTVHGAEFRLVMLDAAGNRYPASQQYLVSGNLNPNFGNVGWYSTKKEEQHFGEGWKNIEGVEVYVTSIMFDDATIWKPKRGVVCKRAFLNSDYDLEMKIASRGQEYRFKKYVEKWNREHPHEQILLPVQGHISASDECPTSLGASVYEKADGKAKVLGGITDGASVTVTPEKQTDEFYWVQGVGFGNIGLAGYVYKGCVILSK